MTHLFRRLAGGAALAAAAASAPLAPAAAKLESVTVVSRAPLAGGRAFGAAGAYERIVLRGRFSIDPALPGNARIADIGLAPRGADGRVTFEIEMVVMQPVDAARSNGTAIVEAVNRGGATLPSILGLPERPDGGGPPDIYPLDRGYTMVYAGWQTLPAGRNRDRQQGLHAPRAPVTGPVRAARVFREAAPRWDLAEDLQYCPAPGTQARARLGTRASIAAEPLWLPAGSYRFVAGEGGGEPCTVELDGGFRAGTAYELVYEGEQPVIAGLGLAALRDVASALKDAGAARGPIHRAQRTMGYGYSQGARVLRQFLADGFNADEAGARAFDGVFVAAAGAGGASVNHRYAHPGEAGNSVLNLHRPVDLFPFADVRQRDPVTRVTAGQLDRARADRVVPRIFHVLTSTEYWSRGASLLHASVDGRRDIAPDPSSRIYFLAGSQHSGGPFPPAREAGRARHANLINPNDNRWIMRGLLAALDGWLRGEAPPASQYPTRRERTLVTLREVAFPRIVMGEGGAGLPVSYPRIHRLDFGPAFARDRIVTHNPPRVGAHYEILFPQVDGDGNEVSGIRAPRLGVPLATYTGWNFTEARLRDYDHLAGLYGSILPFPLDEAERARTGDPRRPILARYRDRADYLARVRAEAERLAARRLLLASDLPLIVEDAGRYWDALTRR